MATDDEQALDWKSPEITPEAQAVIDRFTDVRKHIGHVSPWVVEMAAALADAERSRDELRRAFADGLEQRRLTLLPDTEREVHFAELQDRITELERELANSVRQRAHNFAVKKALEATERVEKLERELAALREENERLEGTDD